MWQTSKVWTWSSRLHKSAATMIDTVLQYIAYCLSVVVQSRSRVWIFDQSDWEYVTNQAAAILLTWATMWPRALFSKSKVSIRTPADVADIWTHLNRGDQIVLWCEGVLHIQQNFLIVRVMKRCQRRENCQPWIKKNKKKQSWRHSLHPSREAQWSLHYNSVSSMGGNGWHRNTQLQVRIWLMF